MIETINNINNYALETSVSLIYLNNCYEIPLTRSENLEEFLHKVACMLSIENFGYKYLLRNEKGMIIKDIQEIDPSCVYYYMLLAGENSNDINSGVSSAKDEVEDENEEISDLENSLKRRKISNSSIIAVPSKKIKRPKGQKRHFVCPFDDCRKIFTETGNLKTHLRTHTGERPFKCSFEHCGKRFITKGHLKSHELIHTGDKPYVCSFPSCNKKYSRSGRLKIHYRTHTGERPFICPINECCKSFTEKGNLKTHLRIHSGEKPYRCTHGDCEKTFTTQGHLTDHQRRHSGERPFDCVLCGKKFMRSSTLKIHYRRHNEDKYHKIKMGSHKKNLIDFYECKKFVEDNELRMNSFTFDKIENLKNNTNAELLVEEKSEYIQLNTNNSKREFISNTVKLMEKNHKLNNFQKPIDLTEKAENKLFLPMNLINHASIAQKVQDLNPEIGTLKNKSPTNDLEKKLLAGLKISHWPYGINTPNTASNVLMQTPFSKNIPFLNLCSSPLANMSNSPLRYAINYPNYGSLSGTPHPASKEEYLFNRENQKLHEEQLLNNAQKNSLTQPFFNGQTPLAGKNIQSPTFSPFYGNSPNLLNTFSTQPSFSMLATFYDSMSNTPLKRGHCNNDKLTTRNAVPEGNTPSSPNKNEEDKKEEDYLISACSTKTPNTCNNLPGEETFNGFTQMKDSVCKDEEEKDEYSEFEKNTVGRVC